VRLVAATRNLKNYHDSWAGLVKTGASPRGSIALLRAAMSRALLMKRDYVIPEDINELAVDVLRHRLILDLSAEAEGVSADDIIRHLLNVIDAP